MRIHPSDPAAVVSRLSPLTRDWREIIALCEERARHRAAIIEERRAFGHIQDHLVGMEV